MLKQMPAEKAHAIAHLANLKLHDTLCVSELVPGTMVRVQTRSKNFYFFHVTKPQELIAEVRCHSKKPRCPRAGYKGQRKIAPVIQVGKKVMFGKDETSEVRSISIVGIQHLQ